MGRLLTIINMLLMAGVVTLGVQTYGRFTAPPPELPTAAAFAEPAVEPAGKPSSNISYGAILRRNLFNTKSGSTVAPIEKVEVDKLEPTKLNLKLWGTVTGTTMNPYAVIEERGTRHHALYRVGDAVQNASITAILREKVVLNVDGRDEVLEMEKATSGMAGSRSVTPVRPVSASSPSAEGGTGETGKRSPVRNVILNRAQISEAMENANDVLADVRIRPHFSEGQADGLSITGIKPASIFRRMGLRNGDVIQEVNGESVASVGDAIGLFQQIGGSEEVQVRIKRRGRDQAFRYTVK